MDEADISGSGTKFFDSFVGFAFCGLGTFCLGFELLAEKG